MDVETDGATHTHRVWNVSCSQNKAFWRAQQAPKWVWNGLKEQEKDSGLAFVMTGDEDRVREGCMHAVSYLA